MTNQSTARKIITFFFTISFGLACTWVGFLALAGRLYILAPYWRSAQSYFYLIASRPLTGWTLVQVVVLLVGVSFVVRAWRKL